MNETKTVKRNQKIMMRQMILTIAIVIVASLILAFYAVTQMTAIYDEMITEVCMVAGEEFAEELNAAKPGDFTQDENGDVYKGEHLMTGNTTVIDEMKEMTGLDYQMVYGTTVIASTLTDSSGQRVQGVETSSEEVKKALSTGESQVMPEEELHGKKYYGYVVAFENSDGTCVGTVCAFRESTHLDAEKRNHAITMLVIALILLIVVTVINLLSARKSTKVFDSITDALAALANGHLQIHMPKEALDRKDELGTNAESTQKLDQELTEIITATKKLSQDVSGSGLELSKSSTQASEASNQVSQAVEEIAKGAICSCLTSWASDVRAWLR